MDWTLLPCYLALAILLLPLVGFVIQTFFGYRLPRKGDWVPTLAIFLSFLIATGMVLGYFFFGSETGRGLEEAAVWKPELPLAQLWLGESFPVGFGILVDNMTIVMLFVVTLVSFLVHLYSWGYMHGEVRYNNFFAYLGLFSFSMLGLCITNNLLFLFIFWELVGLCSYFLIGFYFEKKSAQNAAIKAFITTRIGDLGFFLAILMIAATVGSLDFDAIFASVALGAEGPWTAGALTIAGLCLFLGPVGKSAQFPLHFWLPDAMEGPTPVSALIHAATMVVAGVYLVARMFPFLAGHAYFDGNFFDSTVLLVIALVGSFTAFFAATIAFAQTDIKKVLAYSTVSQLGYMMLGLGVGSVMAGIFHLATHAFFKACLFLGSGSVIHAVHSNEMSDMGGLWKKMRTTWITFGIATLAIAGFPFLAGFWSKEAILGQAWDFMNHHAEHGSILYKLPFFFGIITAGMTCFYMFRLFFKTFHGKPRNEEAYHHAHESPWTMTVPLCVLAVLAVIGGGVWSDKWFAARVSSQKFVSYAAGSAAHGDGHGTVFWLSISMFVLGLALAYFFFLTPKGLALGARAIGTPPLALLHFCLKQLWFVNGFCSWVGPFLMHVFRKVCGAFDTYVVDGFVNLWATVCQLVTAVVGAADYHGVDGTVRGIGDTTLAGGRRVRRLQTGLLQAYVYTSVFLFAGVVVVCLVLVWARVGGQ